MFFLIAALVLFSIFVACLSYKYSPYFISRREKYGKSAYEIFMKRIFMSFTMTLSSIGFIFFLFGNIFPKENSSKIERPNESKKGDGPILIENKEKPVAANPILKMDTISEMIYTAPILENPQFKVKELPILELKDTTKIVPDSILESQNKLPYHD